jgi:Icc-related predicted phosphoesterase
MYFCTDIHGSERCWKKFLATPKHYECDTIVIGGDITGKFIVPVIETKRGKYKAPSPASSARSVRVRSSTTCSP